MSECFKCPKCTGISYALEPEYKLASLEFLIWSSCLCNNKFLTIHKVQTNKIDTKHRRGSNSNDNNNRVLIYKL